MNEVEENGNESIRDFNKIHTDASRGLYRRMGDRSRK